MTDELVAALKSDPDTVVAAMVSLNMHRDIQSLWVCPECGAAYGTILDCVKHMSAHIGKTGDEPDYQQKTYLISELFFIYIFVPPEEPDMSVVKSLPGLRLLFSGGGTVEVDTKSGDVVRQILDAADKYGVDVSPPDPSEGMVKPKFLEFPGFTPPFFVEFGVGALLSFAWMSLWGFQPMVAIGSCIGFLIGSVRAFKTGYYGSSSTMAYLAVTVLLLQLAFGGVK